MHHRHPRGKPKRYLFHHASLLTLAPGLSAIAAVPAYDHVLIVVEENHSYAQITNTFAGSAPYINQTLIPQGASFTKFYGEEHHSEGNYLWMFAGSNFDIGFNDPSPIGPFSNPNLGSNLIGAGYSFKGYSEDLPSIGSTATSGNGGLYVRKHNPWVNFSNVPNGTTVATSSNLRLVDFPTDYNDLPTVSVVIPNQANDMHNGANPATVATGDSWLQSHLSGYYEWAKSHNSLLIVTFDEDDGQINGLTNPATNANQIVTTFGGAGIAPGAYAEGAGANHVNLLRTLEEMYGLPHAGAQTGPASAAGLTNGAISDVFVQWKNDVDGVWSDGAKWVGGVSPSGNTAVANLLSAIGTTRTITLGAQRTINVLNIDNPNQYLISGSGTLLFDAVADGSSKLRVASGHHLISVPTFALKNLTLDVSTATGMTFSDFDASGVNIAKRGGGSIELNKLQSNLADISAGTIAITASGSDPALSQVTSLGIAGGATPTAALDLANNDLIVANGNYTALGAAVAYARHGGAWDRAGITSSSAASAPSHDHTLGTLSGQEFHAMRGDSALFDGAAVSNSDIVVKYTYYGDSDLNEHIDGADYAHIDATFNNEHSAGNIGGWANGDFNYDGKVDGADYGLIDSAFNSQLGTFARALAYVDGTDRSEAGMDAPGLLMVRAHFEQFGAPYAASMLGNVPEPAVLGAVAPMALLLDRARRRRGA